MNFKKTEKQSTHQVTLQLVNLEAEARVIGSILLCNDVLDELTDILTHDDFYDYRNKEIFNAASKLIFERKPADFVSIPLLIDASDWHPAAYIVELMRTTPNAGNAVYFANIVKQKSIDRAYLNIFREFEKSAHEEDEERHEKAQQKLLAIDNAVQQKPILLREFAHEVYSKIIERYQEKQELIGLPTGFNRLDSLTNGFKPGDYVILAARPSMGKTLLALNMAQHLALNTDSTVLFFSLEMTKESLVNRLVTSLSSLTTDQIQKASFMEHDIPAITQAFQKLDEMKIIIDDHPCSSMQLRSKARQVKRQYGLSMIIVDYLQFIGGYQKMEETHRITQISRDLKNLAKELGVPVIVLSQLNRNLEQRQDKRPAMSDLRQSGAIEQDADMILFIYRDEVYNENTLEKGIAEIILAKNRDGETGKIKLLFRGKHAKFENYQYVNQSQATITVVRPDKNYKPVYDVD